MVYRLFRDMINTFSADDTVRNVVRYGTRFIRRFFVWIRRSPLMAQDDEDRRGIAG